MHSQAACPPPTPAMPTGSMKLLPRITRDNVREISERSRRGSDGLNQGIEAALVLVLFLLVGVGLDSWFGTTPSMVSVMSVLAAGGLFATFKMRYEQRMDQLDAERRAKLAGARTAETDVADDHDAETAR